MRNLKQIMLFVMMGSLLTITSCSKDDDSSGGGEVGSGTMTANVDGASYKNFNNLGQATLATTNGKKNLVIQSSNSNGQSINIVIWNYTGPGTYKIESTGLNANTAIYTETDVSNPTNTQIWSAPYKDSAVESIKITDETDSNVEGEFSFKGKNSGDDSVKNITDGKFNLSKVTV
ncbi:DUF6252 family protein [Algibacter sp. 2305UL17-15]|uniref:DUF6252 family protein n=1 Tax=Algibacter sp. 2305UL17-15 TaxID=3231268 RepID=UPI003457995F